MYKDLSLKEKAKIIREGVRLGLTSIDDILNLYDEAISYLQGGPIVSPYGQWKYPGRDTIIPSNNITMDNVNYPVLGISDTGDAKIMMPWNDYKFRGSMVYEHPLIGHLALDGKKFNRLLKLSNWYHRNADNIPKFIHRGIYNTIKDSAFTDEPLSEMKYNLLPNLIHNRAGAYDNAFLMSPKQLEEYLRSIGYNKVEDENYGLVNKAVLNYKNATGREVPIFQYGKDDANRSELIPLKNNIYGAFRPQEGFEDKDHLGDIGAAPYRLYRDKDGNLFYKRWDFFDHGDYSRNSYSASDDEYVVPALTTNSLRYGNILDNMGNPYVKTTGYTRISDPIEINHALSTIEGIPILFDDLYKLYLDSLKSGRYDYLKGGNLFLGDNSKINKLNKRMHYSGGTGKFWGAVANNLFSKEDNYYNGTHYSGLYLSGRQEDLPQGRDHINLYTLGDETGFTRIDNATPITVNGNVYDYNLYEGKILPLDTIYLNPISQLPIDSMIEHKNLLGLDTDYFLMNKSYKQDYPKQYNNTWGYPNVHKGVVLDDTRKVSVSPKKDEKGDYYLDVFDIIDYGGTVGIGGNYIDNIVEKNGSGGPYILRLKVPVVFDAKKQSNGPLLNQLSSGNSTNTWEDYLMKYSPSYNAIVGNKVLPIEVIHTRSYGGNLFKKGGIYIKPENRGKFTALKKRTGHSASWFKAHGTPALRKMATFALNAKHWKHDDGGHLFLEDGLMNTALQHLFDKYGTKALVVEIDKPVTLPEVWVVANAPKPGSKNYDRYIANTYDALKRGDVDINTLPTETRNRVRGYSGTIAALKGMDTAAKVAGITATIPAGIIGGISFAPTAWGIMNNPIVDAALTTHGAITAPKNIKEGVQELQEGNYGRGALDLGLTALDLYGAGNLASRLRRIANPAYRAKHAYNSISPLGYLKPIQRGKNWFMDMWNNVEIDYKNPKWYKDLKRKWEDDLIEEGYTQTGKYLDEDILNRGLIGDLARIDAWAIYNGLPQLFGTYIKMPDGSYKYDLNRINEMTNGTFTLPIGYNDGIPHEIGDFVTGAGGGLLDWKLIASNPDKTKGITYIEDLWDVNPFSRYGDRFGERVSKRVGRVVDPVIAKRNHIADMINYKLTNIGVDTKSLLDIYNSLPEYMDGPSPSDMIKNRFYYLIPRNELGYSRLFKPYYRRYDILPKLSNKLENFEIGKITGGKPFLMKTEIPWKLDDKEVPRLFFGDMSDVTKLEQQIPDHDFNYRFRDISKSVSRGLF